VLEVERRGRSRLERLGGELLRPRVAGEGTRRSAEDGARHLIEEENESEATAQRLRPVVQPAAERQRDRLREPLPIAASSPSPPRYQRLIFTPNSLAFVAGAFPNQKLRTPSMVAVMVQPYERECPPDALAGC